VPLIFNLQINLYYIEKATNEVCDILIRGHEAYTDQDKQLEFKQPCAVDGAGNNFNTTADARVWVACAGSPLVAAV
jgi:hypothetical protein